MARTTIHGKQVKDGSIELVDLGTTVVDELNSKVSANSLATVATSGSYNDLSNKPSIPSLTQVESDISALQAADIAIDARLDVLEAGGTGGGSGGSGSVYISPAQPMVYNTNYTITHNLGIIPSNVQVVLTNTSSGAKFILPDFYVSGGSYYGFDCINVTNTEFTLRTYQDSGYGSCTFEVYVTGGAGGSGSYIAPYITEFNHTGSDAGSNYTITHNLNSQNVDVKVYIVDESTGLETIATEYFTYHEENYGYSVIEKTANAFTLHIHRWHPAAPTYNSLGTFKARVVVSVIGASASSGSGASYEIAEFTHPVQAGTAAFYTITHNLNTLFPIVQLQMLNYSLGSDANTGFSTEQSWLNVPTQMAIGVWWHGAGFHVVDENTVKLEIWRLSGGPVQIRGKVFAGGTGTADLTSVNNSLTALDGRVGVLESASSFSGSYNDLTNKPSLFSGDYNDLSNKPSIPSLTQVETDISNLQAADIALDSRIDVLETASNFSGDYNDLTNKPTIPSLTQVETDISDLQAADVLLDSRIDALESHALVIREIPTGSVDGVNAVFTLANTPVTGSEQVFCNGILQQSGEANDYTISGSTITFVSAPEAGWKIQVSYATGNFAYAGGSGSSGAIVYQDAEFNWASSDLGTVREISHNMGRRPDLIEVWQYADMLGGGSGMRWVRTPDLDVRNDGGYYGWVSDHANNTENVTAIRLGRTYNTTTNPCRIRLYWFTSTDVASFNSAGGFVNAVGGGSSAPSVYESDVVTVPYYGTQTINLTQDFTHNLGRKPTNIQVYFDVTNVPDANNVPAGMILPLATTFWQGGNLLGYDAIHLNDNQIRINFWYMRQNSEAKVRIRCS